MLADIGNGTMNVMYINDRRPQEKKCFTEKYGTHQCMLAVRENLLKLYSSAADEAVIAAVNDYFERRGRLDSDPYLENPEKEDAFLLRVLETVWARLNQSPPVNTADTLLRLLQGAQPQLIRTEEAPQDDQQEVDEAVLDFVDSF